ncbi:MAG TPA: DUF4382 domain-containing protein [Woeseiaceae bacterium]|nr:DUF4382 domain-containing protein [Woeseiaceae bacterium]
MFENFFDSRRIAIATLLGLSLFVAACGGSGDGGVPPGQGTVALLLTDMPTDDLDEINLDVVEATLIGGDGQQTLFSDAENPIHIDLLDLENFSQPIAFEDVPADVYTKLRLRISNLELVEYVEDGPDNVYTPPLPANGKIDLLHPEGFEVLPGRTLIVEMDMDANKSIHVVRTGNNKYLVRPVVFVEFSNTEAPDKLTRLEGRIDEIVDAEAGSFVVCALDNPDTCIDVSLTVDGCVFDADGIPTEPTALAVDDEVVVIGRYSRMGGDIVLDAIVVEQGPAQQVVGTVNSLPDAAGTFLMIDRAGVEFLVELQDGCTQVIGPDGAIVGPEGLGIGQGIEVEGVEIAPETEGDPATLRAALVIIDGDDAEEQVSGTIGTPIDAETSSFFLVTSNGGVTVALVPAPTILVFDGDEQVPGTFADVQEGRSADAYGELGMDGIFNATTVVIETGE